MENMKERKERPKFITLRAKRVFILGILLKDKKTEIREVKPFYQRLLKYKPDFLYMHDQGKTRLLIEVKGVKVIKTPKGMKNLVKHPAKNSFEIKLGLSREVKHTDLKRLKSLSKNEIIKFLKGKDK